MLIVINKINIRNGHLDKVLPSLQENASIGLSQKGCLEAYLAKCTENNNEILIYSRWQSEPDYEKAKKELKKDPRVKKLMFQLLTHVSKHETLQYSVLPL